VTEHDGYTEVVKHSHPGEEGSDGDRGPYLYHVTQERHPDGTEKPHWTFIGVVTDEGDVPDADTKRFYPNLRNPLPMVSDRLPEWG